MEYPVTRGRCTPWPFNGNQRKEICDFEVQPSPHDHTPTWAQESPPVFLPGDRSVPCTQLFQQRYDDERRLQQQQKEYRKCQRDLEEQRFFGDEFPRFEYRDMEKIERRNLKPYQFRNEAAWAEESKRKEWSKPPMSKETTAAFEKAASRAIQGTSEYELQPRESDGKKCKGSSPPSSLSSGLEKMEKGSSGMVFAAVPYCGGQFGGGQVGMDLSSVASPVQQYKVLYLPACARRCGGGRLFDGADKDCKAKGQYTLRSWCLPKGMGKLDPNCQGYDYRVAAGYQKERVGSAVDRWTDPCWRRDHWRDGTSQGYFGVHYQFDPEGVRLGRVDPPVKAGCPPDCPEATIDIGNRSIYPRLGGMIPGYGGHVPGDIICKFGKTYGRATGEALRHIKSNPNVPRSYSMREWSTKCKNPAIIC